MGKSRNRPRSDTSSEHGRFKESFRKLQAENKKLRKENAQLRKQLNRAYQTADIWEPEDIPVREQTKKEVCNKCKSEELVQINTGKFRITVCNSCGSKSKRELT